MKRLVSVAAAVVTLCCVACDAADSQGPGKEAPVRSPSTDPVRPHEGDPFVEPDTEGQMALALVDAGTRPAPAWSNALHDRVCAGDTPEAPALEAGRFVDVTVHAGVGGEDSDPCSEDPVECYATSMTGGAAAADFDGDGFIDLYVTRIRARDSLYLNCRNGTFADVTETLGLNKADMPSNGAVWADVDGDGDLDLFVTVFGKRATRHYLYLQEGGAFREDGLNRGVAMWNEGPLYGTSAAFGDYDGDGYLDLYVGEWRPGSLVPDDAPQRNHARLFRNRGAARPGFFEDVTEQTGVSVGGETANGVTRQRGVFVFTPVFAHLDDDDALDLALASDFGSSRLFWNANDGTFSDGTVAAHVGTDQAGMGSIIVDYDADGDLDWFVTSIYEPRRRYDGNRLYRNAGKRKFEDATDLAGVRDIGWGWGAGVLDYDNDADLDLLAVAGFSDTETLLKDYEGKLSLWQNPGRQDREYANASAKIAPSPNGQGRGVAVFDFDNDGDQDVFVVYYNARDALLRNDVASSAQHWLRVSLRGETNSFGIGGRVTLLADGVRQMRELNSGSGYLSQSESVAHFGLGAAEHAVDLQVRMPDGVTQTFRDVAIDRNLLVVEQHEP
ncbi:MAG TPA: CRTAC1 family protein [Polyangiales bacterium]|nr:CRTAC1 family protein [Polyangiales bacterium]